MKYIFFWLLAIAPTLVSGQDISIHMKDIPSGSWFVMKEGDKTAITVFRGQKGKLFVYDHISGTDPNAKRNFRDLRDAQGNQIERHYINGRIVKFKPHNCQRIVGECMFVESGIDNNGKAYQTQMRRTNTPTRKGFKFEQFAIRLDGVQVHIRSGTVNGLDSKGMLERATQKSGPDKKTTRFSKIKASWD
ncbi:MAG: hypothetical protein ABJ370_12275 [Paracoccaceae bacterium]